MSSYSPNRVGAVTDTGPVRSTNEDRYMIPAAPDAATLGPLYVVADGVGGQQAGDVAADIAVRVVHDAFYQARRSGSDVAAALEYAVEQANRAVYQEAQVRGIHQMGCTLVAAVPFQEQLYVVHVGDARAYLVEPGRLRQLTRDHSWVQEQIDAQTLSPAEAAQHELRNVVTRIVGNTPAINVERSGPFALNGSEALLLCSDGLHDVIKEKQLHQLVTSSPPPVAARDLVRAAVQQGAGDNITVIVVGLSDRTNRLTGFFTRRLGGRIPVWLPIVLVVGIVLLMLLLMTGQPTSTGGAEDTPFPAQAITETVEQGGQQASVTSTPLQRPPTQTPTLTATPKWQGSVVAQTLYVFKDWQLEGRCYNSEARNTSIKLELDEKVYILSNYNEPRFAAELADGGRGGCIEFEFIQVQSIGRPDIIGWVLKTGIQPIGNPP